MVNACTEGIYEGFEHEGLAEIHLEHAAGLQQAVDDVLSSSAGEASVGVMPYGGLVLPTLQ